EDLGIELNPLLLPEGRGVEDRAVDPEGVADVLDRRLFLFRDHLPAAGCPRVLDELGAAGIEDDALLPVEGVLGVALCEGTEEAGVEPDGSEGTADLSPTLPARSVVHNEVSEAMQFHVINSLLVG